MSTCSELCLTCADACDVTARVLSRPAHADNAVVTVCCRLASAPAQAASRSATRMPLSIVIAHSASMSAVPASTLARRCSMWSLRGARLPRARQIGAASTAVRCRELDPSRDRAGPGRRLTETGIASIARLTSRGLLAFQSSGLVAMTAPVGLLRSSEADARRGATDFSLQRWCLLPNGSQVGVRQSLLSVRGRAQCRSRNQGPLVAEQCALPGRGGPWGVGWSEARTGAGVCLVPCLA